MTRKQKLLLEQSEIRQRLNTLLDQAERSADEDSEMETRTARMQAIEPLLRAAIVAEGAAETRDRTEFGDDPEGRELRALIVGASVGEIFQAAVEHRATDGRTAELQAHVKLPANSIPLALLRETEARAVTPAPGEVGTNQQPIIPGVFPQSCAAFLGVDMPTVGVGEAVFPVLATNAVVGVPAEGAIPAATGIDSEGATTGSFSAEVLSPGRLQAAFFYSREDRARFAGMDAALRQNLSDALSDMLDQQILNGTNGLLNGTVLGNHNRTSVADFAHYKSAFAYGRVDGRWAMTTEDLRIVMGSATYAHAATIYRASAGASDSIDAALEVLRGATAGVKVSAHVPALDSNNRQNSVIRLGMRRDMVAPIWEGIQLIPDEITKASTGEIVVTAVMLHAIKVLRVAGFYKQGTQTA